MRPSSRDLLPRHNHITRDIKTDGSCPACARTVEAWKNAAEQERTGRRRA